MSKDTGGLLSKVVKFVRHPTTQWSDLDHVGSGEADERSKQALKEQIERKKRNDFVRHREFDMLRKIRRREIMGAPGGMARPSFFQSSLLTTPDGRAKTLKKIDEIEAQMSMQWWKTKRAESSLPPGTSASRFGRDARSSQMAVDGKSSQSPLGRESRPSQVAQEARSSQFKPSLFGREGKSSPQEREGKPSQPAVRDSRSAAAGRDAPPPFFAPTLIAAASQFGDDAQETPSKVAGIPVLTQEILLPEDGFGTEPFSASKAFAIEVGENAHDPEVEEAAILFANGDDAGAEAALRAIVIEGGSHANQVDTWLALFDLYRATGQQERFESAAIDFVNHFQRSAPQWFSMLESVERSAPAAAPAGAQLPHWSSPASLAPQSLATLKGVVQRAKAPWRLDWQKLTAIDDPAVVVLAELFESWATQAVRMSFSGTEVMERFLESRTPAGDATVGPAWWRLRLAWLRVQGRQAEFEDVAVNYCITYEVSPPSWDAPRCVYLSPEALSAASAAPAGAAGAGVKVAAGTPSLALSGMISGDATPQLAAFEADPGTGLVQVSCARLSRIDFAAAGTLLNWVSARQAQGRAVEFKDVHRLLAAFFQVIGISEQARITLRKD